MEAEETVFREGAAAELFRVHRAEAIGLQAARAPRVVAIDPQVARVPPAAVLCHGPREGTVAVSRGHLVSGKSHGPRNSHPGVPRDRVVGARHRLREDLWDYRADRAEEVWNNARDFHDDVFDDRWWGCLRLGRRLGRPLSRQRAPAAFGAAAAFVDVITPDPIYIDYGMNVVSEDDTVYVDNQPVPAEQYTQPIIELAVNIEQPPPPVPPAEPAPGVQPARAPTEEWPPLGVFALAQEEKGDPTMFLQISVNGAGVISGAYSSTITGDQRPMPGRSTKTVSAVAWRIGDNTETIFRDKPRESHAGRLAGRHSLWKRADPDLAAPTYARARRRWPAAETSQSPENPPPLKTT